MPLPVVLYRRKTDVHKKTFGHVLVVAGSPAMLGACALTCLAAMRSGSGLVTAAVAQPLNLTLQAKLSPVVMTWPLPSARQFLSARGFSFIAKRFDTFQSIAIGPGLAEHPSTSLLIKKLIIEFPGPMVVDAQAIHVVAQHKGILLKAKGPRILTPHEGEMAHLIGLSVQEIHNQRKRVALDTASKNRCVIVLKGHHTVIANDQGKCSVNKTGNPGLATAGSGDVLTGIIAGFLAQGISPYQSACLGVYYHGLAADHEVKTIPKASLIATDLLSFCPGYFAKHKGKRR